MCLVPSRIGGRFICAGTATGKCHRYIGMTETGSGIVYGHPLEGVELRIVNGEVHIRCPMLFRCYRNGDDPFTADGWYPTGDSGRR